MKISDLKKFEVALIDEEVTMTIDAHNFKLIEGSDKTQAYYSFQTLSVRTPLEIEKEQEWLNQSRYAGTPKPYSSRVVASFSQDSVKYVREIQK